MDVKGIHKVMDGLVNDKGVNFNYLQTSIILSVSLIDMLQLNSYISRDAKLLRPVENKED